MVSRSRLIFVVFYVTAVLIGVVHLRTASRRLFHGYREAKVEQKRLVERLRSRQLELEHLVNPATVARHLPQEQEQ